MEFAPPLAHYLETAEIPLRLACTMETNWPIVLSLWYLFEDDALYCATPESAKVVAYLQANPRCSFEVASDLPPYCGVRGRALASIDGQRGWEILERLLLRYLGSLDNNLAKNLLARSDPEVAIRLEPQSLYTWNFSQRMADLPLIQQEKVCPE
jgi:hypothetical protein